MNTLVLTTVALSATLLGSSQVVAQVPRADLGYVSQNGPLGGQDGFLIGIGLPITGFRYLTVSPSLEFARLYAGAQNASCLRLPDESCFDPPEAESFLTPALIATLALPSGRIRPFVGAGPALLHSLMAQQVGVRRTFVTPQIEAGIQVRTHIGRWRMAFRWRRLDRWPSSKATGEYALLLGFRPSLSLPRFDRQ